MADLRVRQEFNSLSNDQKKKFIQAVLDLKDEGGYDDLVILHQNAMDHLTPWQNEQPDGRIRNAAHRGPAFLPWHRQFLDLYEKELQRVSGDSNLSLPYWDWLKDAALPDPTKAPLWVPDPNDPDPRVYIGGNGDPNDNWIVKDGPFANWPLVHNSDDQSPINSLQRKFGPKPEFGLPNAALPSMSQFVQTMAANRYDSERWDVDAQGFRGRLEGFQGPSGEPAPYMHNIIHVWIGGSMLPGTSPNDPVFFMHHCFVDRLWADWQNAQREHNPNESVFYEPLAGGPTGHNIDDGMFPWNIPADTVTPSDMLDHHALGYQYDNEVTVPVETTAPVLIADRGGASDREPSPTCDYLA